MHTYIYTYTYNILLPASSAICVQWSNTFISPLFQRIPKQTVKDGSFTIDKIIFLYTFLIMFNECVPYNVCRL